MGNIDYSDSGNENADYEIGPEQVTGNPKLTVKIEGHKVEKEDN